MNPCSAQDALMETQAYCVRSTEAIETLRPHWERMQRHPNTDIDFYLTILNARPEIRRPHVVVVGRDGEPRLLVVGRLEQRPSSLSLGYKVFKGPMARVLVILYDGILGQGTLEDYAAALGQIRAGLAAAEFDMVEFNHLDVESPMYSLLMESTPAPIRINGLASNPHHRLTLGNSYEEYQQGLSHNTRKTLRRYRRRLLERWDGRLEVKCYRDASEMETVMRDAETIASKTYQRGLGVGFQATEEMRRRLRLELERGWLRAYFLYLDGRAVAFSFINGYRGVAYANETGYDPEFRDYRVGHYLNELSIEDLCAEGALKVMDFGLGDADYKRAICDQVREEKPVLIFAPTARGLLLYVLYTLFSHTNRGGRWLVEKIRLLPQLKRMWRSTSIPARGVLGMLMSAGGVL